MLPCKNECNATEFLNLGVTSFTSLASYIPLLPESSNCFVEFSNLTKQCLNQISNSFSSDNYLMNLNGSLANRSLITYNEINLTALNITSIVTNLFGENNTKDFGNYSSSSFQGLLEFSDLNNSNSTFDIDCSMFSAMDNKVLYKIEFNTIQNIFSSVDPVFLRIYQMINGPGSRVDQFVLVDSLNSTVKKMEYIDYLNNTVGNINVKKNHIFIIFFD